MVHKVLKKLNDKELEDLWEGLSLVLIRNKVKIPDYMQKTLNDVASEGYARREEREK